MTQSLGGKTVNMKQLNTALCMTQNCDKWQWIKWLSVSHCEKQIPIKDFKQSLIRNESDKIRFKNFIIIKEQETILFFICILPDYVSHESSKEFWRNSYFEHMRADFLGRSLNSLWQTSPEMMHFQAWKKMFLTNTMS